MIHVLFVCLGNICRSPMAEFLFRDMVKKEGLADFFTIASAATGYEEVGNPVHHGTRDRLAKEGISVKGKVAMHLEKEDYVKYDYILGMEERNLRAILRIVGSDPDGKVSKLLDFSDRPRDIADPIPSDIRTPSWFKKVNFRNECARALSIRQYSLRLLPAHLQKFSLFELVTETPIKPLQSGAKGLRWADAHPCRQARMERFWQVSADGVRMSDGYTGNFDVTYDDIMDGLTAFLAYLRKRGEIG